MKSEGIADVEVHIHHDGEGEQNFVDRVGGFTEKLARRHGLLHKDRGGLRFGFIHGNWALDNSLPGGRHCGLNNELSLLRDLGCYADFTLPSAPLPTQARMVNKIYWAVDDPERPKSYDRGVEVKPGGRRAGDLMMIPGPLALRRRQEGWRLLPRMERGELQSCDPVSAYRVGLWLKMGPRIGDDVFIKLFTHGAQEKNSELLLGGGLDRTFQLVLRACGEENAEIYFVSAWEMWRAIDALRRREDPISSIVSPQDDGGEGIAEGRPAKVAVEHRS
jgi:hypothetical protein